MIVRGEGFFNDGYPQFFAYLFSMQGRRHPHFGQVIFCFTGFNQGAGAHYFAFIEGKHDITTF